MTPNALVVSDLARRSRAPSYVGLVLKTLKALVEHVAKPVAEIETQDVRVFLAARAEHGISARTQRGELSMLRTALTILVESGGVRCDPTEGLAVRSGGTPPQPLLSEADVQALLGVPPNGSGGAARALALRDRALVELLYGVGLRVSEVVAARVLDLQLGEGTLLARRVKRGKPALLPLPPASVAHVHDYLRDGRPVLVGEGGRDEGRLFVSRQGEPLTRLGIYRAVRRAGARVGVRAYPHALRRAVATHLIRSGVSVSVVQQLLGHASLATTAHYLSLESDDMRRAVVALEHAE